MSEPPARGSTRQVLNLYEEVTYDGRGEPRLAPSRVMGIGALYGCDAVPRDVLDLGCGTGAVLSAAGHEACGRLVGVEMSESYCRKAEARCKPLGDRVKIICADVLDLAATDLGQFDLIYIEGFLYVVPPEAQRHVLDLAAKCLRPGGVVVVSYYSGPLPAMRAELNRLLRARRTAGLNARAAIAEARELMRLIGERAQPDGLLSQAIKLTSEFPDSNLFHEVMNPHFETFHTVELEVSLARMGLGFLNYIDAMEFGVRMTSAQRALEAEIHDLESGGYHRALFGRWRDGEQAENLRAAGVVWETSLVRTGDSVPYRQVGLFRDQDVDTKATVPNPLLQAFLDGLADASSGLTDGFAAAREKLSNIDLPSAALDEARAEAGLLTLWNARLVTPRRKL